MKAYRININEDTELILSVPSLEFSKTKDEGVFFRHKLETPLVFTKDSFRTLFAIEESENRCDKIPLVLSESGNSVIEGYFALNDGNWSKSLCRVEIPIRNEDEYTCFKSILKKKVNVFNGVSGHEVKTFTGTIEQQVNFVDRSDFFLSSPSSYAIPPAGDAWVAKIHEFQNLVDNGNGTYAGRLETTWVRADAGGGVYLEPPLVFSQELSDTTLETDRYLLVWEIVGEEGFPNGKKLEDILLKLVADCGLTIKSDFFGINPEFDAPDNTAYQEANTYHQNTIVFGKSDVKRPDAASKQSVLELTLESFLEQLEACYKVFPSIKDGKFILEHISFYSPPDVVILDLTGNEEVEGLNSYTREVDSIPRRQDFTFMEDVSTLFSAPVVEFSEACATEEGDPEPINASLVNNDIPYIISDTDKVADKGMVFASTQEVNGEFIFLKKATTGTTEFINGPNAWINLIKAFHVYDQYEESFLVGLETVNAESLKALRFNEELKIRKFSLERWLAFNPEEGRVKFDDNLWEVENASWVDQVLTLNLKR